MTIYTTDPKYIKFLDCKPEKPITIGFNACDLIIREGSNVLGQVSLCDFRLEALGGNNNPNLGGCGGFTIKKVTIKSRGKYILTAPEIGQEQGEVQMIVVKVLYPKEQELSERYLTWEYKGGTYPLGELMVLTGRTKPNTPWYGWDLSYYSSNPPASGFSPQIYPPVASPDLAFGGIVFNNPGKYDVNLEIFIFN